MKAFIRVLILIAAVLLAAGCGVKSAYNNADWLLMRWIDDRVSLTPEQRRAIRSAVDEHLAWHCKSELPAYEAFLRSLEADVASDGVDEQLLQIRGEQVAEFGRRILERVRPGLIDLLAGLSDEQVSELVASFDERNRKVLEEAALSEEARNETRVERMSKTIRRFAGRLTERQRDHLEAWARGLHPTAELALEERLAWQAAFGRALGRRQDRPAFERDMDQLMRPGWSRSSSLDERRLENRERTIEVIATIRDIAPRRQQERLSATLSDLAQDIRQLACR